MTDPLANRSAFKRDILWVLAHNGEQPGVEIRNTLMGYYGQPVNHGQLYPNLNELVEAGLINKGKIDGRTNSYALTERGRQALSQRHVWEVDDVNGESNMSVTDE